MTTLPSEQFLLLRAEGRAGTHMANRPPSPEERAAQEARDAEAVPQTVDIREAVEMIVPLRNAKHLSHVPISIPSLSIEMLPREECVQAVMDRLSQDRKGALAAIRVLIRNHRGSHISVEDEQQAPEYTAPQSEELVSA